MCAGNHNGRHAGSLQSCSSRTSWSGQQQHRKSIRWRAKVGNAKGPRRSATGKKSREQGRAYKCNKGVNVKSYIIHVAPVYSSGAWIFGATGSTEKELRK